MAVKSTRIKKEYNWIGQEVRDAMDRVLENGVFYKGPFTRGFEEDFAALTGTKYGIAANSGTSGMFVILLALGIGSGDEVIVPANGFVTVAEATANVGARPVFVDVEPETLNLDLQAVKAAITPKTKAIVPIHNYGQPVDMEALQAVAGDIPIIEDCAHANGARIGGRRVGSMGAAGFFSFAGKGMSVLGLGGMVTTNDDKLADDVRLLRDHGRRLTTGDPESRGSGWYNLERIGHNLRLTELHAAIGQVHLKRLDEWNSHRRKLALLYNELFAAKDLPVEPLAIRDGIEHAFLHYVVRVPADERDALRASLDRDGIDTAVMYPLPLHLIPAYQKAFGHQEGEFPVSEQASRDTIAFPNSPGNTEEEVRLVVEAVQRHFSA